MAALSYLFFLQKLKYPNPKPKEPIKETKSKMNIITEGTFNGLDISSIINVLAKRNKFPIVLDFFSEKLDCTYKKALLTLNNKAIGFYIWTYPNYNKTGSFLQFLLIDKKYQNQGYGTYLINHYFEWCKTNKRPHCMVECIGTQLQSYYKKFGYTFARIDKNNIVAMTKKLY